MVPMKAFSSIPRNFIFTGIVKRFAGHSKWQNIRHTKAAKDADKASTTNLLLHQIRKAVLSNGGSTDPTKNYQLNICLNAAKKANINNDTIKNFLTRLETTKETLINYTLRGPQESVFLFNFSCIPAATSHTRETVKKILKQQSLLQKTDAGLNHIFENKGVIIAKHPEVTIMDGAEEAAILAGAEEVSPMEEDNSFRFGAEATSLWPVVKQLREDGWDIIESSVELLPHKTVTLSESEMKEIDDTLSKLQDLPEFLKLSHNLA